MSKTKQLVENIIDREHITENGVKIIDKDTKKMELKVQLRPVKLIMNGVSLALFIITGFSFMSVMFFAMKERAEEIGIKKAFGAKCTDILFQFCIENIILSIIAYIIAIWLSLVVSLITEKYRQYYLERDYLINITASTYIKPFVVAIIVGLFFTIIPSIRYSLLSPNESIKTE